MYDIHSTHVCNDGDGGGDGDGHEMGLTTHISTICEKGKKTNEKYALYSSKNNKNVILLLMKFTEVFCFFSYPLIWLNCKRARVCVYIYSISQSLFFYFLAFL